MFVSRLSLALLASTTLFAPATYAADTAQDAFARPAQLVDIGGRRMNLHCNGTGPVTVILDAPSGDAGWTWFQVQPELAKRTRTCAYDRAGLGFSDPSGRTGNAINAVEDLHALLGAAGIAPPYVMVGSSYGGGIVQLYSYRYPSEVKGLVLSEAQFEDETSRLVKASGGKLQQLYDQMAAGGKACAAQAEIGFVPGSELWNNCIGPVAPNHGRALGAARIAVERAPAHWRAAESENTHMEEGDNALRAARKSWGDLPVIVLTRGLPQYAIPNRPQSPTNKAMEAENVLVQKEMAAFSTRGSQRVVPGSHHVIHLEQPQAVVKAVNDVVDMVTR
ncbi:MAG: alpha/beta fold hydrolase [Massilia sp.]